MSAVIPAMVRLIGGEYVVCAVGPAPQHKPLRPMRIRRHSARHWVLECDGNDRSTRWRTLREARYAACALDEENRRNAEREHDHLMTTDEAAWGKEHLTGWNV